MENLDQNPLLDEPIPCPSGCNDQSEGTNIKCVTSSNTCTGATSDPCLAPAGKLNDTHTVYKNNLIHEECSNFSSFVDHVDVSATSSHLGSIDTSPRDTEAEVELTLNDDDYLRSSLYHDYERPELFSNLFSAPQTPGVSNGRTVNIPDDLSPFDKQAETEIDIENETLFHNNTHNLYINSSSRLLTSSDEQTILNDAYKSTSFLDPTEVGKFLTTEMAFKPGFYASEESADNVNYNVDEYFSNMALSSEEQPNPKIWSIITDTPLYTSEPHLVHLFCQPGRKELTKWKSKTNPSKHQKFRTNMATESQKTSTETETLTQSEEIELEKSIPCDDAIPEITEIYDHQICISTTVLYSKTEKFKLFQKLQIPFDVHMHTKGALLDGTNVRVLVDSGATCSLLALHFVKKHKLVSNPDFVFYKIKPLDLTLGDGRYNTIYHACKFRVLMDHVCFEVTAWVVPMVQWSDFTFGAKSFMETELNLDVPTALITVTNRAIPIRAVKRIHLPFGKTSYPEFELEDVPNDFIDASVVCKLLNPIAPNSPLATVKTSLVGNKVYLKLVHTQDQPKDIIIEKGEICGYADMRSCGYLFLSRGGMELMLCKSFMFVHNSEEETNSNDSETNNDNVNITTNERPDSKPPDAQSDINANPSNNDATNLASSIVHKRKKAKRIDPCEDLNPDKQSDIKYKDSNLISKDAYIWKHGYKIDPKDPYPWLENTDERKQMSDSEIIRKYISLDKAKLTNEGKEDLYKLCEKYRDAFSLRDEIGECTHLDVDIELKDDTPFFIRPYPIKESEKGHVDREMRKGCLLGILRKGLTSYSSPIMLIPRKQGGILRIVSDFRYLNARLKILQCSLPLMRDAIQTIGASEADIASIIDLRDAFHTLRILLKCQKYFGITPYFGSPTYIYQRMPMGLSVSPAIFMFYITKVLDEIEDRQHFIAIMDDILTHSKYMEHLGCLERLFQILIKNGLRISPKKCQFFMTEVIYMGLQISYKTGRPTITPTTDRVEAIAKIKPLQNINDVRSFVGMVNYLSMFLKNLQGLLVPIYDLLRKDKIWNWSDKCQTAFDEIKALISNPPVLSMPDTTGHFTLASDTSKEATGSALYQTQDGHECLVSYHSKRLNEAAVRYSISELELHGLSINVKAFQHYLRGVFFTVIIDHSALVYILKSKREPPTLRLKKLIESLFQFNFEVKFLKGKEMFISDFLSRHPGDDPLTSESDEVRPVMFTYKFEGITYTKYELLELLNGVLNETKFVANLVRTRSQTKKDQLAPIKNIYPLKGVPKRKTPPVTPVLRKTVRKDKQVQPKKAVTFPHTEPDYREFAREDPPNEIHVPQLPYIPPIPLDFTPRPVPVPITVPEEKPESELTLSELEQFKNVRPLELRLTGHVPAHDDPDDYRQPDAVLYNEKQPMFTDIQDSDIMMRNLPTQSKLNKYLKQMKHKVLKNYDIPLKIKEVIQAIKKDPFFKDIYKYLETGQFSHSKYFKSSQQHSLRNETRDYILINSVLFRLKYPNTDNPDYDIMLCIPEIYIPALLYHYHDTLLAAHQGMLRTYFTLRNLYFAPNLFDNIRKYILCCYECQSRMDKAKNPNAFHIRIPYSFKPMSRISLDIKHMPLSNAKEKYILLACCEFSNYVVGVPLKEAKSIHIAEALLNKVIYQFGPPSQIITDLDRAITSQLMMELYRVLGIRIVVVSPENHGSNRVERYIRTISEMLCKQMTNKGANWPSYLNACCYAHNSFVTSTIGYCPYELVYLHKPPLLTDLTFEPLKSGDRSIKEYMTSINERFNTMKSFVIDRKLMEQKTMLAKENRFHLEQHVYAKGDLVYYFAPRLSELQAPARKFKANWIGPCQITQILDESHYMLADSKGIALPMIGGAHIRMIKPFITHFGRMKKNRLVTIDNIEELKRLTHSNKLIPL